MPTVNYTGERAGQTIARNTDKLSEALSGFQNTLVEGAKFQYGERKKEEADFLKNVEITPELIISTKANDNLLKMIDGYNKKWSAKRGDMSIEEKSQMLMEKNAIKGENSRMLNQQKLWEQINSAVVNNPDKFSEEEWSQITSDFINTDKLSVNAPPIKAQSMDLFLVKNKLKGTGYADAKAKYSATEEEAREYIRNIALSSPAYLKGLIKDFGDLDESIKMSYLDVNKDNVISESEAKDTNPILQWAQDSKWQKAVEISPYAPKTVKTSSKSPTINLFGKNVSFTPGSKREGSIKYADQEYSNAYEFDGAFKIANIPTVGGAVLRGRSKSPITTKGNIEGYLKNYDADKDVLIVAATGTDPNIDNGTLVEIPASNLNQAEVNKIPVTVNGVQTTIGALRAGKQQAQPTPSAQPEATSKWEVYKVQPPQPKPNPNQE